MLIHTGCTTRATVTSALFIKAMQDKKIIENINNKWYLCGYYYR